MIPIPERLRSRPRFRGLPIPFTVLVQPDGTPDFRVTDPRAWGRTVERKLCGLCGQKLGLKIYFVGGEKCFANRLFFDPAMHLECARYAIEVCPFLAVDSKTYSDRPFDAKGITYHHSKAMSTKKPRLALMTSTGYRLERIGSEVLIRANHFIRIEWLDELKEKQEVTA